MSYVLKDDGQPSYQRNKIDLPRFAIDLAKALAALPWKTGTGPGANGIRVLPVDAEVEKQNGNYRHDNQTIRVGADDLDLRADNWKGRVNLYLNAPDIKWGDWSTYDKAQKTESASINPDGRPIEAIAKDIKKRVIDANREALAARRAYAEQQKQNRANIVTHANALKTACPKLDIRVNESEQNATIYSGPSAYYLNARMNSKGRVSIDRMGDISNETFRKIIAVLEASEPKES